MPGLSVLLVCPPPSSIHHLGGRPLACRPGRRQGHPRARAAQVRRAARCRHGGARLRGAGAHPAVPRPVRRRQDAPDPRAAHFSAHRAGKAYVGYAQMTPTSPTTPTVPARLRRTRSRSPYDPDQGGEKRLGRLHRPSGRRQGRAQPAALRQATTSARRRRSIHLLGHRLVLLAQESPGGREMRPPHGES